MQPKQEAAPAAPSSDPDFRLHIELLSMVAVGGFDHRLLDGSPAFVKADLRTRGAGHLEGAGFRMILYRHGFQGGFGLSIFAVDGVSLGHGPVGADLHLSFGRPWGMVAETFFGRAFDFGWIVPYVDARLGLGLVRTSVDIRSDLLATTHALDRCISTPIFGPRIGARIPLPHGVGLDFSGSFSPVGVERTSFHGGLSFTPDLRDTRTR